MFVKSKGAVGGFTKVSSPPDKELYAVSKCTDPSLSLFMVFKFNGLNLYFFGLLIFAGEDLPVLCFQRGITQTDHRIFVRKKRLHTFM